MHWGRKTSLLTVVLLVGATVSFPTVGVAAQPETNASSRAFTSAEWVPPNMYEVEGVPEYLTVLTKATIIPTGPHPVCSMEYAGQTRTAAPWEFTLNPVNYRGGYVDVLLCDGEKDYVTFDTTVPYSVDTTVFYGGKDAEPVELQNNTENDARYTVTSSAGKNILAGTVAGDGMTLLSFPTASFTSTERFSLTVTGGNVTMTIPLVYADGWAVFSFSSGKQGMPYRQCETVTWSYDTTGAPTRTKTLERDIREGLNRISRETNLTFTQVNNPDEARLRFLWNPSLGSNGPSAVGGTDGTVELNTKEWWLTDPYAGFGPWKKKQGYRSGPAGRGWLIIHETMHTMGYEHTDNKKSIMYPLNHGQYKFTKDDRDGLQAMYPRGVCPIL